MRTLTIGLVALLALASLPADATHCRPATSASIPLGAEHYAYVDVDPDGYYGPSYDAEIWRETNGVRGLQRVTTPCIDGDIPADQRVGGL